MSSRWRKHSVVAFVALFLTCYCAEDLVLTECSTPSGERGYCVEKRHCVHLRHASSYSRFRRCGEQIEDVTRPSVCCEKNRIEYVTEQEVAVEDALKCTTPNGYKGQCVPLQDCPSAHSKQAKISLLKEAVCDFKNRKICCGPEETFSYVCGLQTDLHFRISSGNVTAKNEFPWVVILEYSSPHICGGSLINSQFVLTAAHCLIPTLTKVRIGGNFNEVTLQFNVLFKKRHEGYRGIKPIRNDIALIKIQKVTYQESIKWICLPPKSAHLPNQFVVVGSGKTETGDLAKLQLKGTFPLADLSECRTLFGDIAYYENVICAGGTPGVDSCKGDSGGPLMAKDATSRWRLYGIVSQGTDDCTFGNVGIYTKVDDYVDWIHDSMKKML